MVRVSCYDVGVKASVRVLVQLLCYRLILSLLSGSACWR